MPPMNGLWNLILRLGFVKAFFPPRESKGMEGVDALGHERRNAEKWHNIWGYFKFLLLHIYKLYKI
jgi:hypothetical protein